MKIKIYLGICFLGILTIACNEDIVNDEVFEVEPLVEVIDNILKFRDFESYQNIMDELQRMSESELEDWEIENNFYSSMRRKYAEIENMEDSVESDIIPWQLLPDPFIATVVNYNGVFMIADTIHIIRENDEVLILDGDFDKLRIIENSDTKEIFSNVKYIDIQNTEIINKIESRKIGPHYDNWIIKVSNPCGQSNLSTHLKARRFSSSVYSVVGVRMTGRKHKDGQWRDDKIAYGKLTGEGWIHGYSPNGYYNSNNPWILTSQSEVGRNEKNISKNLMTCYGYWTYDDVYILATYQVDDYECGCGDQFFQIKWHDKASNELVYKTTGTIDNLH